MNLLLLIAAVVIILCVLFNKVTQKVGIPTLLAFILLGMAFGSDGLFRIAFDDYAAAEQICSVALIFIMFYGGFGTRWSEAKPIAGKAVLLSTMGVVLTAGLVGLFCHFVLKIELLESLLIGSVISSTDAASVFSILRSKRLGLTDHTASLLEVESGSNDPFSYMLTVIILSLMSGSASVGQFTLLVLSQLFFGVLFGVGIAFAALFVLRRFHFASAGFDSAFVMAVAVLAYALPSVLGGNGYLGAYLCGIILGNFRFENKKTLVNFFDGVTGIMQILIFFLLGLLAFPSQLPQIALPALAIALFLTFVARPIAVFALLTPLRCKVRQQLLISFTGLRGAASIVFAIMSVTSNASTSNDVFHIVFFIVLLSILFQGALIPYAARGLKMVDPDADVLKTFSDYQEEVDVQFMELNVTDTHPWQGKSVRELTLPPDTLLVMLIRNGETMIPSGGTEIISGDIVVLSAPAFQQRVALQLVEVTIEQGSQWSGKKVSEYSPDPDHLILMIKRKKRRIIPHGNTVLCENDILVMNLKN